jgi:hypothetical protein
MALDAGECSASCPTNSPFKKTPYVMVLQLGIYFVVPYVTTEQATGWTSAAGLNASTVVARNQTTIAYQFSRTNKMHFLYSVD